MIPADCVIICNSEVSSSESALTGESEDMRKSRRVDCFLLSSCLITDGDGCRALVIGIGLNSQWGKIKANLVTNSVNTPLQDKLEIMTTRVRGRNILTHPYDRDIYSALGSYLILMPAQDFCYYIAMLLCHCLY
jgi:hypothetical protein